MSGPNSPRSSGVWAGGLAAQNRVAANVVKRGTHFTPKLKDAPGFVHAKERPPTVPYLGPRHTDLTGIRFGHFTVIGVYQRQKERAGGKRRNAKTKGASWLVRCACGAYETRKAKSIKNPNNSHDRCRECRAVAYIKEQSDRHCKERAGLAPLRRVSS